MLELNTISFSFAEGMAIAGLAQGLSVLIYLVFRVREWRQSVAALACFGMICACFVLQFSLRLEDMWPPLRLLLWLSWTMVPALSYLLVLQIATVQHVGSETYMPRPKLVEWLLVLLPLGALLAGYAFPYEARSCDRWLTTCNEYMEVVNWLDRKSVV